MTKGAPSDDFFGIEYISASNISQEAVNEQKLYQKEVDYSQKLKESDRISQLEGSKFIDDQFFPEISRRTKAQEENKPNEEATQPGQAERLADEFYEQYGMRMQNLNRQMDKRGRLSYSDIEDREEIAEEVPKNTRRAPQVSRKQRAHDNFYDEIRQKRGIEEPEERRTKPSKRSQKPLERRQNFTVENEAESPSGLRLLRAAIAPVWTFTDDQLVNYLAQRVILSSANLIAFDKPYALPYSGSADNLPQFDRILQKIKAIVAPKIERLYLVRSLDKHQSGIILFATSKLALSEAKEMLKEAKFTHRCLVRGVLEEPLEITIPLMKKMSGKDLTVQPVLSNKVKGEIIQSGATLLTSINSIEGISYIEAETTKEATHQLRCHLGLAKVPLIGDSKYGNNNGFIPRLPNHFLSTLNLSVNQGKKVGPYSHLLNMTLPSAGSRNAEIVIHAPLPDHFKWILRKLKFLKR